MLKKVLSVFVITLFAATVWLPKANASTQSDVVSIAKRYLGAPYQMGGTSPNGFDCSGFVQYVFNKVGINLPRTTGSQYRVGKAVSESNLQPGDLVFFHTYKAGVSHVGIYIGNDKFISSTSPPTGVAIDNIDNPYYWGPRYVGARRVIKDKDHHKQHEDKNKVEAEKVDLPDYRYVDVPKGKWFYKGVTALSKHDIINGVSQDPNEFAPSETVTRAEAATMFARAEGLDTSDHSSSFDDVRSNFWAVKYIEAVKNAGLMIGTPNNGFNPHQPITRRQIAILFNRAFDLKEVRKDAGFTDVDKGDPYYQDIRNLAAANITTGFPNHKFKPNHGTTRAQFAVMLYRAKH